jgi:hypothetical protein
MKRSLALLLFVLPLFFISSDAQVQSIGHVRSPVIYCSGAANNCVYPYVRPNTTGIIVARMSGAGGIIDSLGDVWTEDQCNPYDNGDCIFSTRFNVPYLTGNVKITFPANEGAEVFLLTYDGVWTFDQGNQGNYAEQNYPFSVCAGVGDCPYGWTVPVEVNSGELLITWAYSNTSAQLAHAGFGYTVEASSGTFAVEDMFAPIDSVYIGSLEWKSLDGTFPNGPGGSHWLMGTAAYEQQ